MISLAVPVQPLMFDASSVTSFSSVTGDGTNDTKSFADCLKETKDDSDKEDQTASTTSQPHPSPKRAATQKGPHHKTAGEAPGPVVDIAQPHILDPRSLMLSWKKPAEDAGKGRLGALGSAAQTAAPSNASNSTSRAPVAFGVSLPKEAGKAPQFQAQGTNANGLAGVNPAKNAQADADASGDAPGGQPHSQNSPDDTHTAPIANTAAAVQARDAVPTTVAPSPAPTDTALNAATLQSVPVAYTQSDVAKSAAPVMDTSSVAAVDEPPAAATLRPHSIEIQVPGTGENHVDVRVSQRAGTVDVTVRTPDNELAQSLRQHLPELSDRLSQNGVNGEIWQPTASAETSNGNSQSEGEASQDWQGQQQQNQQQAQTNPDSQQNRRGPNWVNEFYNAEQEGR